MLLQDDGKLAIFRGKDPDHSNGLVRRMRPRYTKKPGGKRLLSESTDELFDTIDVKWSGSKRLLLAEQLGDSGL